MFGHRQRPFRYLGRSPETSGLRLAQAATSGLIDPAERLRPLVQPMLDIRTQLRGRRDYATADALRDALTAAGIDLRDTPNGAQWSVRA